MFVKYTDVDDQPREHCQPMAGGGGADDASPSSHRRHASGASTSSGGEHSATDCASPDAAGDKVRI
jgi:hypothetical protein